MNSQFSFLTVSLLTLAFGCAGGLEGPHAPDGPSAPITGKSDRGDDTGQPAEISFCDQYDLYDDGFCDRDCARPDPDCEGVPEPPAPEEDPCADAYGAESGECDTTCTPGTWGCPDEEDLCLEEERYADGVCDEDCPWTDSDCADDVASDAIEDWERDVCSRLPRGGPISVREFARSVCIEREDQALVDCIGACVASR